MVEIAELLHVPVFMDDKVIIPAHTAIGEIILSGYHVEFTHYRRQPHIGIGNGIVIL